MLEGREGTRPVPRTGCFTGLGVRRCHVISPVFIVLLTDHVTVISLFEHNGDLTFSSKFSFLLGIGWSDSSLGDDTVDGPFVRDSLEMVLFGGGT